VCHRLPDCQLLSCGHWNLTTHVHCVVTVSVDLTGLYTVMLLGCEGDDTRECCFHEGSVTIHDWDSRESGSSGGSQISSFSECIYKFCSSERHEPQEDHRSRQSPERKMSPAPNVCMPLWAKTVWEKRCTAGARHAL
jgi:hypothetical protein